MRRLAAFLFCAAVLAQSPEEKIDRIFATWNGTAGPGCAVAAMQNGRIVLKRAYGMADLEHDVPLRPDSVFHVASVSKQFTAAAIVLLAQQGKLSLDDPVRKHLPGVPDFGAVITLRQLIHHTSGLRDQWELLGLWGWRYSLDLITDDDVMSVMGRQKKLNFAPGERHLYCNTGYTLLGQTVKAVSGKSLREFTTAAIFQPLGMASTHFRDDHAEIVRRQALGYSRDNERKAWKLSVTNFDTVGATSLLTTVEDLALWDRNFDQPEVGGPAFIEQMHQRGRLTSGETIDYAFGLVHGKYKGLRTVEHGGADAGYRSAFLRFPEQRFTVACLCNAAQSVPTALARQVADIYLADKMEKPAEKPAAVPTIALTADELASVVGLYWNDDDERLMRIEAREGKLFASSQGAPTYELQPVGDGRFRVKEQPAEFRFGPRSLIVSVQGRAKDTVYVRTEEFRPSESELPGFVGRYRSDEIDPVYEIALAKGRLELRRMKQRPAELRPLIRDVYRAGPGTIRFTRDSSGKVTGFNMNTGRIRGFEFRREPAIP